MELHDPDNADNEQFKQQLEAQIELDEQKIASGQKVCIQLKPPSLQFTVFCTLYAICIVFSAHFRRLSGFCNCFFLSVLHDILF